MDAEEVTKGKSTAWLYRYTTKYVGLYAFKYSGLMKSDMFFGLG